MAAASPHPPPLTPGRRSAIGAAAGAVLLGVGGALFNWLGTAGGRAGVVLVGLALTIAPAAIVIAVAGVRSRSAPTMAAGAVLIGVVLTGLLAAHAPFSSSRLGEEIDHLAIKGSVVRTIRTGNGRCRPLCPGLERVYETRSESFAKLVARITGTLQSRGLTLDGPEIAIGARRITAGGRRVRITATLTQLDPDKTRVDVLAEARRP